MIGLLIIPAFWFLLHYLEYYYVASRKKPMLDYKTKWQLTMCWKYQVKIITYLTVGQKIQKSPVQKNSSNQINQKIFFHEMAFLTVLNFSQFKNWFLAIFEIAKHGIRSKNFFSWNWFIWFHEFFWLEHF